MLNLSSWATTLPIMAIGMVGIFLVIGMIIPVSYTHLDVYKRQRKGRSLGRAER